MKKWDPKERKIRPEQSILILLTSQSLSNLFLLFITTDMAAKNDTENFSDMWLWEHVDKYINWMFYEKISLAHDTNNQG